MDNKFVEGNSQVYNNDLSRPLATKANAVKLRWLSPWQKAETIQINVLFSTPDTVTVEAIAGGAQDGATYRAFNLTVMDGNGQNAGANTESLTSPLGVDVANLDKTTDWRCVLSISKGPLNVGNEESDTVEFFIKNPASYFANPAATIEIDTVKINSGALALYYLGNKVADGGTISLGNFTAGGTSEPFQINVKADGAKYVDVLSTSFGPDVLSFEDPAPYGRVYPNTVGYFLSGTVDTSGAAGAYTGTLTVEHQTASGPVNYSINVEYNLV